MGDSHGVGSPAGAEAIWLTTGSHFLNDAYSNVYPTLVPLVAASMGFGLVTGSLVITGVNLASSALQPLFGAIVDRRATALLTPVTLTLIAVCTGLLGFVHDAIMFIALACVAGMANGAFHPSGLSLVRSAAGSRPGWYTSIFFLGGTVGRAVGPVLMVLVAALMGVRGLALLAVPGILLAVGLAAMAPRGARDPQPAAAADAAPAAIAAPPTGRILRDRLGPIALLMAIAITRGTVTTAISTFWPLLHQHTVAALFGSSAVIAAMLTAGGIGNVWGGRLSDRVAHQSLLAVTCVAAALSLAGFALVHGPWTYVLATLSGLFGMSGFAVTTVMGQNLIPERVAMASGLFFGLANALTSATVALLALAAAAWGGPAALLLTAAVCLSGLAATLAYPSVAGGRAGRVATPEVSAATT